MNSIYKARAQRLFQFLQSLFLRQEHRAGPEFYYLLLATEQNIAVANEEII